MFKQSLYESNCHRKTENIFSIFKNAKKDSSIHDLYDLIGIRIIVDKITDCYSVLGLIHAQFNPISERFKDYIALSKPNGYQSLHSTVLTKHGRPIEIQIRTQTMNQTAEFDLHHTGITKINQKRKKWLKN